METKWKRIKNYVYEERNVGAGQFSEIFVGQDVSSGERVAVKVIAIIIKQIDISKMKDQVLFSMMNNEIEILRLFAPNPNILRIYDVYQQQQYVYIITEYCDQGSQKKYLGDLSKLLQNRKLTEDQSLEILWQLINALLELKQQQVIHRDIKPANILFQNAIPKLADFGFAICKKIQMHRELENYNVGSPIYMAPETLINNIYSFKSDIWSTGVVLYEMLFSCVPFISATEPELVQKLQQYRSQEFLYYPSQITYYTENLLKNLLAADKDRRWSAEQCYEYLALRKQNNIQSPIQINVTQQQYSQHRRQLSPMTKNHYCQQFQIERQQNSQPIIPKLHPVIFYQQNQPQQLIPQQQQQQQQQQSPPMVHNQQYSPIVHILPSFQTIQPRQPLTSLNGIQKGSPVLSKNYVQSTVSKPFYLTSKIGQNYSEQPQLIQHNRSLVEIKVNEQSYNLGLVLQKIVNLFSGLEYFECYLDKISYSKQDIMALFIKLQYCILNCNCLIFSQHSQYVECYKALQLCRNQIQQNSELFLQDVRFLSLYNGQFTLDAVLEATVEYLKPCILRMNEMFRLSDCSNSKMIVLLDYLVTLNLILKLFFDSNSWGSFNQQTNLERIINCQINYQATRTHWQQINQKIRNTMH